MGESILEWFGKRNAYLHLPITSLNSFDIYNHLLLRSVADKPIKFPSGGKGTKMEKGAYVFKPTPGIYRWVAIFDFSQHYPRIIKDFNLGPDTLDPNGKIIAANGTRYKSPSEQRAYLASYIDKLLAWRFEVEAQLKNYDVSDPHYKELKDLIMAIKQTINSVYGVMGNPSFRLNNKYVAEAITANGRKALEIASSVAEQYGYKTLYGDSVVGDTLIHIKEGNNIRKMKIEDLFKETTFNVAEKEYYVPLTNIYTLSMDRKGNLQWKRIKYVMRHYIKGDIRQLTISNGLTLSITKEHSIMRYVNTSNSIFEVIKPDELKQSDKLIFVEEPFQKFKLLTFSEVSPLNFEGYVYDIEVEDNHNFFANGILVHNTDSIMIQIDPPKDPTMQSPDWYENTLEKVNALADAINTAIHKWERESGVEEPTMKMSFEALMGTIVFANAKKKYFADIVYDGKKGDIHNAPLQDRLKIRGFELRRSDSAILTRKIQSDLIEMILNNTSSSKVLKYLHKVYKDIVSGKVSYRLLLRGKRIGKEDSNAQHIKAYRYYSQKFGWSYQGYIFLLYIHPSPIFDYMPIIGLPTLSHPLPSNVQIDWEANARLVMQSTIDTLLNPIYGFTFDNIKSGYITPSLKSIVSPAQTNDIDILDLT